MNLRLLAALLAAGAVEAAEFSSHTIELPPGTIGGFTIACGDADGDGRAELLVLAPAERMLRACFQRADGFRSQPDQAIELPAGTAWVRLCDVAPDAGLELVFSVPAGLRFFPRAGGRFGSTPRSLLDVPQVIAGDPGPLLLEPRKGEESLLPVFLPDRTVLYEVEPGRAGTRQGLPGASVPGREARTIELEASSTVRLYPSEWSMGAGRARRLHLRARHIARARDPELRENAGIRAAMEKLEVRMSGSLLRLERADLDGDGREDVLIWNVSSLPFKTTAMVFLSDPEGRLPESAGQVLRCSGLPARKTEDDQRTLLADIDGDGRREIVLCELRTNPLSVAQIADMFISKGVEWNLAIRSFLPGKGYADRPDARIPFTALPHSMELDMIHLDADLDGDGRKDLAVRRSPSEIDVFPGRKEGWFAAAPAFRLDCPVPGDLVFRDLNGDRASDIIALDYEGRRIGVHLSRGAGGKR
jgi:hypothetical protein